MDFKDLPKSFRDSWEKMSYKEQTALIACLSLNKKQQKYAIKAKAEIGVVAPILHYISKHKIPHEVTRRGKHVVFYFEGMELRNQVLIGKNTI